MALRLAYATIWSIMLRLADSTIIGSDGSLTKFYSSAIASNSATAAAAVTAAVSFSVTF